MGHSLPYRAWVLFSTLLLAFPLAQSGVAAPLPAESLAKLPEVEVRCSDGSVLKLRVIEEQVTLKMSFGKLTIPFGKIQHIECATRLPEELAKRVEAAIDDLGSDDIKKRNAASAELGKIGARAYPALVRVEDSSNPEVQRRVKTLLERIRNSTPEEGLKVRKFDVVVTADSKLTGELEGSELRVNTDLFGDVRLKLSDVRELRGGGLKGGEDDAGPAIPDPGNMQLYQGQIGKVLRIRVLGVATGALWGSDVYTLDSTLGMAAAHAGVVGVGKTGVVKVRILAGQANYQGTTRNGINSMPYANFPGSFEFIK
jgi:hypothetical protein